DCYAYSDSVTDLPMLEAVGHPRAVNPDRALRRIARERQWPVLAFDTRSAGQADREPSLPAGAQIGL
ncbi:MAG TPA: HAD-IB family hydrolase, partial [Streptosporangiaceae bacterium]|nr:HAD-IB family hydrolase [Streptosporangiaceae bacterium]